MKRAGAVIVDPAEIPNVDKYGDSEFEVLLYEFKADLNGYLAERGGPMRTLQDLIEFNEEHAGAEMPYFGQEIFEMAQGKGPLTDPAYREALANNRRLSRGEGIDAVMDEHDLDALVAPTNSPPWTTDLINGDHFLLGSSSPAAVAGYPNVTVPAGYSYGLPVGISFMGRAYSEGTLIRLAYAFEQATRVRRAPRFLPTADLSLPDCTPETGTGDLGTEERPDTGEQPDTGGDSEAATNAGRGGGAGQGCEEVRMPGAGAGGTADSSPPTGKAAATPPDLLPLVGRPR